MKAKEVKRGDIFYADLSPVVGSEQGGQRPVLIIQNDVGNHFSTTVIVAPITTHSQKKPMPTHVPLTTKVTGIPKNSVVLLEQVRTIDKQRLMDRIDHLDTSVMKKVNQGLRVNLNFNQSGSFTEIKELFLKPKEATLDCCTSRQPLLV